MVHLNQTEMRSLLVLWSLGASQDFIKKSDLPKHYRSREIWQLLLNGGSIQEDKKKREIINKNQKIQVVNIKTVKFTDHGLKKLADCLNSGFVFEGKLINIRLANAVLEWFRKNQGQTTIAELQPQPIKDYDEFKQVALETYERINYEFNYNKLVPVHAIRRDIDNRVTRTQFNDWMLEMHRSNSLYLHGDGFVDATEDQIRDSIYNDVLKTLCFFAEKLNH